MRNQYIQRESQIHKDLFFCGYIGKIHKDLTQQYNGNNHRQNLNRREESEFRVAWVEAR